MANFACDQCERTYAHTQLVQHVKKKHTVGEQPVAKKIERPLKTELGFKCGQCGRLYMHRRNLARHVTRYHNNPVFSCNQYGKSYDRSSNLVMHKRTCTGPVAVAVAAPAVKRRRTGDVVPEFTVRKTRKSLGGAAEMFAVEMKEANHLSALQGAVTAFKPSMDNYHRNHRAYKFQLFVDVVSHKAVDPAVITQPLVTLTSEMVVVYASDVPPLCRWQILWKYTNIMDQVGSFLIFLHFN